MRLEKFMIYFFVAKVYDFVIQSSNIILYWLSLSQWSIDFLLEKQGIMLAAGLKSSGKLYFFDDT